MLHLPDAPAALAARLGMDTAAFLELRRAALARLAPVRAARPRPLLDDKVLADWNGFAIAALARAARVFGRPDYVEAAEAAAAFVLAEMRAPDGGLLHRWHSGEAAVPAFLDDYAFLAWGLTELYETTFDEAHLETALELVRRLQDLFADPAGGGHFLTHADAEGLLVRQKALDDGAMPSGNAVAAYVGLRLGALVGDEAMRETARRALSADIRMVDQPTGFAWHLVGAQLALGPLPETVVAPGDGEAGLWAALGGVYAPGAWRLRRTERLARTVPFVAEQLPRRGNATAYVCEGGACQAPTTHARTAAGTLDALYRRAGDARP